jgi:3-oxoacyl-[acyl-carrier protein] reductase
MDLNLKDKVAIVTGGSRGLGKAICMSLAAEGARIAVNYYRNPAKDIDFVEEGEAVAQEIRDTHGVDAIAVGGDIGVEDDVAGMFDEIEGKLGPVDICINNAGVAPTCATAETPLELWESTYRTNITGTFLCCRETVKRMLATGRKGRIVNISSQAALRGSVSGKSAYDSSKGAVRSFTISLGLELAKHGIGVNCVVPGLMHTEMLAKAIAENPQKYHGRSPMGRVGEVHEIADVAVFLASERASYMTGATVDVSGGLAMH